jgi:CRP-like cAMP-binding protein
MSASRHLHDPQAASDAIDAGYAASRQVAPSNFLAQLLPSDHADLLAIARTRGRGKGEAVFSAGEPGSQVFFLRAGKVKIGQVSPLGREVILWFCFPGEVFGIAEVARGGERVVNAVACVKSELLVVPQSEFMHYLAERPQAALLCMQVLSSRLRVLGEMFVNLVSDDVSTRIAKLILRLSARYGTRLGREIVLNIPLTHQEIADMTGTTRPTVTATLTTLRQQRVLSIDNRRIRIESEELLCELARAR